MKPIPRHGQRSHPKSKRMARFLITLLLVGVAGVLVSTRPWSPGGTSTSHAPASATLVPPSGVWLGTRVNTGPAGPARRMLSNLEASVGQRFEIVQQQLPWNQTPPWETLRAWSDQRRILLLSWEPRRLDGSVVPLASIARGDEDQQITAIARGVKALNTKLFLAFGRQPAGPGGDSHTANDYAKAYRHVHDIFIELGVTTVAWVWTMMAASEQTSVSPQPDPGDAYVDWLALDVGDRPVCDDGPGWRPFAKLTRPFHDWAVARHPARPVMVTGYGMAPHRPVSARIGWLTGDRSLMTTQRPEIKAVVYAGADQPSGCDGRMATSSQSSTSVGPATAPAPGGGSVRAAAPACLSSDRLAHGRITRVTGAQPTYRVASVPDDRTYDLRGATIVGYPGVTHYPFMLGKSGPGKNTCLIGGQVVGQQSRALSWRTVKHTLDGDGVNFRSEGGAIDGVRIDNVEDGIATTGGDPAGLTIRNAYLSYIRDDCIENDWFVSVSVQDTLLDGCFNGVSERPGTFSGNPSRQPAGETFTLDGVLLRLQPMPYDREWAQCPNNAVDGLGSSGFFKWSGYANRLVVRNTVLMVERNSVNCSRLLDLPGDGIYENVTLVWLGSGSYPGRLPLRGVTVTRDRQVWDSARADWLARHGYSASRR
jgi:hypothetical protein